LPFESSVTPATREEKLGLTPPLVFGPALRWPLAAESFIAFAKDSIISAWGYYGSIVSLNKSKLKIGFEKNSLAIRNICPIRPMVFILSGDPGSDFAPGSGKCDKN